MDKSYGGSSVSGLWSWISDPGSRYYCHKEYQVLILLLLHCCVCSTCGSIIPGTTYTSCILVHSPRRKYGTYIRTALLALVFTRWDLHFFSWYTYIPWYIITATAEQSTTNIRPGGSINRSWSVYLVRAFQQSWQQSRGNDKSRPDLIGRRVCRVGLPKRHGLNIVPPISNCLLYTSPSPRD